METYRRRQVCVCLGRGLKVWYSTKRREKKRVPGVWQLLIMHQGSDCAARSPHLETQTAPHQQKLQGASNSAAQQSGLSFLQKHNTKLAKQNYSLWGVFTKLWACSRRIGLSEVIWEQITYLRMYTCVMCNLHSSSLTARCLTKIVFLWDLGSSTGGRLIWQPHTLEVFAPFSLCSCVFVWKHCHLLAKSDMLEEAATGFLIHPPRSF